MEPDGRWPKVCGVHISPAAHPPLVPPAILRRMAFVS